MPKLVGVRWEEARDAYLRMRKMQIKEGTYKLEVNTMRAIDRYIGGNQWLTVMDGDWWWGYFYDDEDGRINSLGAETFNADLRRCRAFVEFANRRGWLGRDVAEYLRNEIKTRKLHRRQHLILTPAQLIRLVECAALPSHRVALAVGANTALRGSEIMGIKLGRINLDAGEMLVTLWKQDRDEIIPITSRLDGEIRRWLVEYERLTISQGLGRLDPDWYLVPGQRPVRLHAPGSTLFGKDSPQIMLLNPEVAPVHPHEMVQRAMDRMGVEYEANEGFHTLRRGFARAFYDGLVGLGDPNALRKTSALLHHVNTAMTERYLGLTAESTAVSQALKGVDFLGNLVRGDNVVPLRREGTGGW